VGGGDTRSTFLLMDRTQKAFVKIASSTLSDILLAEVDGLDALAAANVIRAPGILALGTLETEATHFMALEALDLHARNQVSDHRLGQQLARLHAKCGQQFGWHRDNYLGATPQDNSPDSSWVRFFWDKRLEPQTNAIVRDCADSELLNLFKVLRDMWFECGAEHTPDPALIHGDLWAGNAASLADETPVIFDPAIHFGDRECDLAMADLFGGYGEAFYSAYQSTWPLPPGWKRRRVFYQIYHLLNHANLFGAGYLDSVKRRIQALRQFD
jgi:fructosamine-3-kinase